MEKCSPHGLVALTHTHRPIFRHRQIALDSRNWVSQQQCSCDPAMLPIKQLPQVAQVFMLPDQLLYHWTSHTGYSYLVKAKQPITSLLYYDPGPNSTPVQTSNLHSPLPSQPRARRTLLVFLFKQVAISLFFERAVSIETCTCVQMSECVDIFAFPTD